MFGFILTKIYWHNTRLCCNLKRNVVNVANYLFQKKKHPSNLFKMRGWDLTPSVRDFKVKANVAQVLIYCCGGAG